MVQNMLARHWYLQRAFARYTSGWHVRGRLADPGTQHLGVSLVEGAFAESFAGVERNHQ